MVLTILPIPSHSPLISNNVTGVARSRWMYINLHVRVLYACYDTLRSEQYAMYGEIILPSDRVMLFSDVAEYPARSLSVTKWQV